MKLVSAYDEPQAAAILYALLAERPPENFISHHAMPTMEEHLTFLASRPFRFWLLVEHEREFVGAVECLETNEIGISILRKFQRRGMGTAAMRMFLAEHHPLPAILAKRNGHWLANVAPSNTHSLQFFARNGFRVIQHTMERA